MSKPTRISDVLHKFELYDVPTICRDCGTEWIAKAFKPADDQQRFGHCESCLAIEDAPKLKLVKDEPDLHPPRRTWEPD